MPNSMSAVHFILVDFDFGWWVTILWMVGELTILRIVADHPWYFTYSYFFELSLVAKFQVCSTLPSGRFWIVGDHPWNGG